MSEAEYCTSCRAPLASAAESCGECGSVVWLFGTTQPEQLETATEQRSWTRHLVAAAGLAAAVGVIAAGWAYATGRQEGGSPSRIADRMVPAISVEHNTATLPATLPDGTRLVLSYPAEVGLATLGAHLYVAVDRPDPAATGRCCSYFVTFTYARIAELYPSVAPAATYAGAHGAHVLLFHASQRATSANDRPTDQLVFTSGPWVAEIPVRAGPEAEQERVDLAAHLQIVLQTDGFPVLHYDSDLQPGPDMGTGITFGDSADPAAPQVSINAGFCSDPGSNTAIRRPIVHPGAETALIWCDERTGLLIEVSGPAGFTTVLGNQLTLRTNATK